MYFVCAWLDPLGLETHLAVGNHACLLTAGLSLQLLPTLYKELVLWQRHWGQNMHVLLLFRDHSFLLQSVELSCSAPHTPTSCGMKMEGKPGPAGNLWAQV